jgi:type VI secretion system secreted protein VgrG
MADLRADTERFTFEVEGLDEELRVVRFQGSEAVSQLFRFELTVAAESPDLKFDDVVNQPALLTVEGDGTRHVNGIVSRIEQSGQAGRFTLYDLTVVPAVWRLKLRHDCRIFQEKSVKDIVTHVLDKAGVPADAYRFDLQKEGGPRTYCVQYRESDWDFVSRLLEEEGIYYFFEHGETMCKLVMADHTSAQGDIEGEAALPYVPAAGLKSKEEHVTRFSYAEEMRPGKVTLTDYNFTKPSLNLAAEATGETFKELEIYDFPGEYLDPAVGKDLAQARLEALNAVRRTAGGESDSARLTPGYQFELTEHPRETLNAKYAVTQVFQTGDQPQVLEERGGGGAMAYVNRFECIPADVPYRPARTTPKPVVEGVQTAIVVGPSGEEIYTDEFGRIKVQFHWDREGTNDDASSCWIRVSQVWAGAGWGAIHIPRIGHEVIVDFVEGDPDRPIITGHVYHGTNRPPYALPDNKTQSGLKSDTSPGGGGSNELRFEDKAGSEEVFLHAQKDFNTEVENDLTCKVKVNETLEVGGDRTRKVAGNESATVEKDRTRQVNGEERISIAKDLFTSVGGNAEHTIDKDEKVTVGGKRDEDVAGTVTQNFKDDLTLSVTGAADVETGKNYRLESGDQVIIKAAGDITLSNGSAKLVLKKNGDIQIKGKKIEVKGSGDIKLKGSKILGN